MTALPSASRSEASEKRSVLDSMHPQQTNAFAAMAPLLAVIPTLARTGLARLLVDPKVRRFDA